MKTKLLRTAKTLAIIFVFVFGWHFGPQIRRKLFSAKSPATNNLEYFDSNFEDSKSTPVFKTEYDNLSIKVYRVSNTQFKKKLINIFLEVKNSKSTEFLLLKNSNRAVVDFKNVVIKSHLKLPINTESLKGIRVGRHADKIRVVLDLRDHLSVEKTVEVRNLNATSAVLTIVE